MLFYIFYRDLYLLLLFILYSFCPKFALYILLLQYDDVSTRAELGGHCPGPFTEWRMCTTAADFWFWSPRRCLVGDAQNPKRISPTVGAGSAPRTGWRVPVWALRFFPPRRRRWRHLDILIGLASHSHRCCSFGHRCRTRFRAISWPWPVSTSLSDFETISSPAGVPHKREKNNYEKAMIL